MRLCIFLLPHIITTNSCNITSAESQIIIMYFIVLLIANLVFISAENSIRPWGDSSMEVKWSINQGSRSISFTITSNRAAQGWVGIGISDNGRMLNSDLNICYVGSNNNAICSDGYAQSYSFTPDSWLGGSDSLSNVSGYIDKSGLLTVSFSKPLNAGDQYDKTIARGRRINVLFAYRERGNPSTEGGRFNPHTRATAREIVLWE
jgi:hypothetical protein